MAPICLEPASVAGLARQVAAALLDQGPGIAGPRVYSASRGERRQITLTDGSQLDLNSDSRVEVTLDDQARRIALTAGEVLLRSADDPRPFVVEAGAEEIQLGVATLHVRLRSGARQRVDVLTGNVWLRPVGSPRASAGGGRLQPLALRAGQFFETRSGVRIVGALDPDAVNRQLAWTVGDVWFLGDTLTDAVEEFNRYNSQQLVVGDTRIAGLRIGGHFQTHDVDGFVHALRSAFDIGYRVKPARGAGAGTLVLVGPEEVHPRTAAQY